MSLATTKGWQLRQLDVNNAFLQGSLSEDVFMQQPPGFTHPQYPQHVCKLRKAIYGFRQAPRAWYTELSSFLTFVGLLNSKSDTLLFLRHHHGNTMYILVYVDDIIVTGNNPISIQAFIKLLAARFSLKDLGPLS